MKLLIAGSRAVPVTRESYLRLARFIRECGYHSLMDAQYLTELTDSPETNEEILARPDVVTEVVSGGARGADQLGEDWALNAWLPVRQFIPNWERYSRSAGPRRNREMGDYADALVAVWDGESPGTRHMVEYMRSLGKPVHVLGLDGNVRSTQPVHILNWPFHDEGSHDADRPVREEA